MANLTICSSTVQLVTQPGNTRSVEYADPPLGSGFQGDVSRVLRLDGSPSQLLIKILRSTNKSVQHHAEEMVPYLRRFVPDRRGGLEALPSDLGVLGTGRVCYFMAYVPGQTLEDGAVYARLAPPEQLGVRLQLGSQLASALERLHEVGIVHADLSDDNVLIDLNGNRPRLYLIDFDGGGIAASSRYSSSLLPLVVGKPDWWAPELWLRDGKIRSQLSSALPAMSAATHATLETDLWALATLVHMLLFPVSSPKERAYGLHPFSFSGNQNGFLRIEQPWPPNPDRPGQYKDAEEWYLMQLNVIGPWLLRLFSQAFSTQQGRFSSTLRPTAHGWYQALAACQRWVRECGNQKCRLTFVSESVMACPACGTPVPHAQAWLNGRRPFEIAEDGYTLVSSYFRFGDGRYIALRFERWGREFMIVPMSGTSLESKSSVRYDERGALLFKPGTHRVTVWSRNRMQNEGLDVSIPDA